MWRPGGKSFTYFNILDIIVLKTPYLNRLLLYEQENLNHVKLEHVKNLSLLTFRKVMCIQRRVKQVDY